MVVNGVVGGSGGVSVPVWEVEDWVEVKVFRYYAGVDAQVDDAGVGGEGKTGDAGDSFWVVLTCAARRWAMTYFGRVGSRGDVKVWHGDFSADVERAVGVRLAAGFRLVEGGGFRFLFPVPLVRGSLSLRRDAVRGGRSVWCTRLVLEAFFKGCVEASGGVSPCRQVAGRVFCDDSEAFVKASYMVALGFDPYDERLFGVGLEVWRLMAFLGGV